jgi:hypothetical protein
MTEAHLTVQTAVEQTGGPDSLFEPRPDEPPLAAQIKPSQTSRRPEETPLATAPWGLLSALL